MGGPFHLADLNHQTLRFAGRRGLGRTNLRPIMQDQSGLLRFQNSGNRAPSHPDQDDSAQLVLPKPTIFEQTVLRRRLFTITRVIFVYLKVNSNRTQC